MLDGRPARSEADWLRPSFGQQVVCSGAESARDVHARARHLTAAGESDLAVAAVEQNLAAFVLMPRLGVEDAAACTGFYCASDPSGLVTGAVVLFGGGAARNGVNLKLCNLIEE